MSERIGARYLEKERRKFQYIFFPPELTAIFHFKDTYGRLALSLSHAR